MTLIEQDQGLPSNHPDRIKSLLDYPLTRRGLFKLSAALAALSACQVDAGPRVSMTPENKLPEVWSRLAGPLDKLLIDQSGLFLSSGTSEVVKIGLGDGQELGRSSINGGNLIGLQDQNLYLANLNKSTQIAAFDKETLRLKWKGQSISVIQAVSPNCYSYKNRLAVNYAGTTVYDSGNGKILAEPRSTLIYPTNASESPDFVALDENNKWLVGSVKLEIPPSNYLQSSFRQDQLFNLETLDFVSGLPKYQYDMEVFGVAGRSVLYNLSTRTGPDGVAAVDLDSKKQKWYQKGWQLIQRSDSVALARLDIDDSAALLAGFDVESGRKIWEEKVMPDLGLTRVGDQFYGIQTVVKKEAKGMGAEGVWYLNLLKLNHQTGKTDWSTLVDGGLKLGLSIRGEVEMVPAKRRLGWLDNQYFVVSNEKNAYLVSSESGKVLGQAELLEPMPMSFYKKHVAVSEAIRPQSATSNDHEVFMGIGSHLFVVDKARGSMRLERYYDFRILAVEAAQRQLFVKVGGLVHCYQTS